MIAVEGAILIESKYMNFFDEMWVVTLDREVALQRIQQRNPNLSVPEIKHRLERQLTDQERLEHASWSMDTSKSAKFDDNKPIIDAKIQQIRESIGIKI